MSAMIDLEKLDDLARRLSSLVPPSLREGREELQENFKSVLQSGLAKLDLVTREEFEVQRAVLLRTREKLDELERTVADLESQLDTPSRRATSGHPPWVCRSCTRRARVGVRAPAVRVEVHVGGGLPSLTIVGLPHAARARSQGSRARRASSARNSSFPTGASPSTSRRRTCPSAAGDSTCRSRSASWRRAGSCRTRRCAMSNSSASSGSPANCARSTAYCRRRSRRRKRSGG